MHSFEGANKNHVPPNNADHNEHTAQPIWISNLVNVDKPDKSSTKQCIAMCGINISSFSTLKNLFDRDAFFLGSNMCDMCDRMFAAFVTYDMTYLWHLIFLGLATTLI